MENLTRKQKAAATKEKIFSTAVQLFKRKGYDNVTVSEICADAGIAKGSFYTHYHSKEDIVRESYYEDLGNYVESHYKAYLQSTPKASGGERILRFLRLELEFAEFAGHELTCLAYALNLGACIPGPSEHLQKRTFSQTLYQEIVDNLPDAYTGLSADGVFTFFESVVRGIMATWCFSGQSFQIKESGAKYLALTVGSIFPLSAAATQPPHSISQKFYEKS